MLGEVATHATTAALTPILGAVSVHEGFGACTLAPRGEYGRRARRRCGLMSSYFEHFFEVTTLLNFTTISKAMFCEVTRLVNQ